jgi:Ca2+-binding RTX toxin-like protein
MNSVASRHPDSRAGRWPWAPIRTVVTIVAVVAGFVAVTAAPSWAAPPSNDNFANAQTHTTSFTDSLSNVDATVETGEPTALVCVSQADPDIGNTVWYGLTISAGTEVSADTLGSDFDTVLAVYTGANLTSLTEVGCNDDDDDATDLTSKVTFTASASTTYWIQAGGYHGFSSASSGNLDLNVVVTPPAAADVSVALSDSADPVSLGGANVTYTAAVANTGTAGATGVSVATTLSGASSSIVSSSTSQGSCSTASSTVTCSLGSLAASGTATITVTVTPNATGTITATAVATLNETDANSANNTDAENTTVNNNLGCTITGTSGNDTLNGTNGADVICGLGGNDTINGGNNDDTIYAGPGNDTVDGGNSDDILYGGDGDDIMGGGNGADYLYGEAGNDTNYGETLLGSLLYLFDNGNDHIYGGPGNDDLDGQNGNDVVSDTDPGDTDTMSGNLGNDTINVQDGAGDDTANGGLGSDTCTIDTGDTTSGC